jgi:hypothetical protein
MTSPRRCARLLHMGFHADPTRSAKQTAADHRRDGGMSLIEKFLAPYDDREIVLADRYNLALVATRPRRAFPQDATPLNRSNHDDIVRTAERENT